MFNIFKKKNLSEDFVDLSIGRVYFKTITHKIKQDCITASSSNDFTNTNLFLQLMEYSIVNISKKRLDNLSLSDGDKLREELIKVLVKYDLFIPKEKKTDEKEQNEYNHNFHKRDIEWFDKQKINSFIALKNSKR